MADKYRTAGSDGVVERFIDQGSGTGTNYWTRAVSLDANASDLYPTAPIVTVYSPSTTAYMKVTPNAANLHMHIAPRVVTQTLVYAPLITHKIGDATTIAAADADDLAKSKTLIDEILPEANTHIASTAYHVVAGTAAVPGHKTDDTTNVIAADNMSNLGTGYTLADELEADLILHAASTTYHQSATVIADMGATPDDAPKLVAKVNLIRTAMAAHFGSATVHTPADAINAALVNATTAATDEATAQTCINLLKSYYTSHLDVGDATAGDLAGVCVHANGVRTALLAHYASTSVHGGTADATNLATLTAVPAATDAATSYALLNAEKATLNLHYAVLDGGGYVAVPLAGLPLEWDCLGSVWVKTDTSAGVFTTTEWRSA